MPVPLVEYGLMVVIFGILFRDLDFFEEGFCEGCVFTFGHALACVSEDWLGFLWFIGVTSEGEAEHESDFAVDICGGEIIEERAVHLFCGLVIVLCEGVVGEGELIVFVEEGIGKFVNEKLVLI